MPYIPPPYTQYGGIWKLNAASAAQGAGTWAYVAQPHLFSWGQNNLGQLGLGNITYYSSPKQVGSLTNWLSISCGTYHTLAVKTDGTLWSWGANSNGQLGLGNTTNYSSPKQVGSLTSWASVYTNTLSQSSYAIKADGTLWAWGYNNNGQLGLGNTTYYSSPKQVGSLTNWASLAPYGTYTIATKTDGTLWAWGVNVFGNLGLGNTVKYSSPKQVGLLTNWLSISSGSYFTIATKTDNTLWSWGYNAYDGPLGQGNTTTLSSPKQVGLLTDWTKAAAGSQHVAAIKTDGTLWTWGKGVSGALGLGNTTTYFSPKQVGVLTDWLSITSGYQYSTAIKTNGTLWGWGSNPNAFLQFSSPAQAGTLTTWSFVEAGRLFTVGIAKT